MKNKAHQIAETFATGGIFLGFHALFEHGVSWHSMTNTLVCFGLAFVLAVVSGFQSAKTTK